MEVFYDSARWQCTGHRSDTEEVSIGKTANIWKLVYLGLLIIMSIPHTLSDSHREKINIINTEQVSFSRKEIAIFLKQFIQSRNIEAVISVTRV